MIKIYNEIIPFGKDAKVFNLFGIILFIRKHYREYLTNQIYTHERIHGKQMKKLLYIPFYVLYGLEWFIRLFMKGKASENISFEREAYLNQHHVDYLNKVTAFSWTKYLNK